MFIILESRNKFSYGGTEFTLSSEILRYIEFEDVVVFWLRHGGREDHIVGVKFTTTPHNHFYVAWEYIVGDWEKYQDSRPTYVKKIEKEGKPLIEVGTWDCVIYTINPDTGEEISKMFSKW